MLTPDQILTRALRLNAQVAQQDLHSFIRQAWSYVEPTEPFVDGEHIRTLCRFLMDISAGKITRAIINIPPGTMKSLCVSVFWPAWEWASNPSLRYLCASSGNLAIRDNIRLRDVVSSAWYQRWFDLRLKGDQNEKIRFNTHAQGWRIATSVGGIAVGEHPDRTIIDDPHKPTEVNSDVIRKGVHEWIDRTISTRGISRGVRIVLIMQRLHEDDATGHLLAQGGWEHLMLPMYFEAARADKRDHRKVEGQLLWPELLSEAKLASSKIQLGSYGVAGQFQQRPAPEGGGLFRRDWLPIIEKFPRHGRRVRFWDVASTEGAGDYTVGVRISEWKGIYYIEDVVRVQMSPKGVDDVIAQTAARDGYETAIVEEQEGGSSGKAVIAARLSRLAGYDYRGKPSTGDKVVRARGLRAQAEGGNVRVVTGHWNDALLDELCIFPNGKHDDQVDAAAGAFNELTTKQPSVIAPLVWG